MPRATGVFEKAGFHLVAHPAAFYTLEQGAGLRLNFDPARSLRIFELAAHEWIGLCGLLGERPDRSSLSGTRGQRVTVAATIRRRRARSIPALVNRW